MPKTKDSSSEILQILKRRFEKNRARHKSLSWSNIQSKLEKNPQKLKSLIQMEETGGEPDLLDFDKKTNEYVFCDFSVESPSGRRSLCYDEEALNSRKEHKPKNSALEMAISIGVEILDEEQYRLLQTFGDFDTKTSSWIKTPADIRKLGGATFADRRYNTVFVYHNGAESYYAARGFRGALRV
jgi:hypothetical protein